MSLFFRISPTLSIALKVISSDTENSLTHSALGKVLLRQVFMLLGFKASLCQCVPMLHMRESGWNGNFSTQTFREESKKVLLPLC